MSGELEAAGSAITAGLAAGAIEGGGRDSAGAGHGETCLNCAATLAGGYCHACGQPAHVSRTLSHFLHEALHSLLHYDAKAWRTLPQLAVRPGTMTADYIAGRRARYVSPMALFLFAIFLMFFVFAFISGEGADARRVVNIDPIAPLTRQLEAIDAQLKTAESEATASRARLAAAEAAETANPTEAAVEARADAQEAAAEAQARVTELGAERAEVAAELRQREARIQTLREKILEAVSEREKAAAAGDAERAAALQLIREGLERQLADQADSRDWRAQWRKDAAEGRLFKFATGNKKFDEKINSKIADPEFLLYKLQNTAYKFSFLLVPLSLPFIALLFFWKRGVTLFDHVVFSLYSLSFMSVLFILAMLAGAAAPALTASVGPWMLLIPPTHLFFHLKGAYRLGFGSALWRTLALLVMIGIVVILFLLAILALGLLG